MAMSADKVDAARVKAYYDDPSVVEHYRRATANIGLWLSEEIVFTRLFGKTDRLIDLGTGTGRIAIGLAELGYAHVLGLELSREMVKEARRIARLLELPVAFRQGDATRLKFEDNLFDGAIFGFNGLMQIPGKAARREALREIRRVIRPGGALAFTTHDRQSAKFRKFWQQEQARWDKGRQKPELLDFGDRWEQTPLTGEPLFIHVPAAAEVREELRATGWKCEWDSLRSAIASESLVTRQFSDECRFWVARKPLETPVRADPGD
jgi:ubiquinone/menaquinone biosynthesis C-methylase UbiE